MDIFSKHIGRKNGKHDNHILELKKHNCIMQKMLNTCKNKTCFNCHNKMWVVAKGVSGLTWKHMLEKRQQFNIILHSLNPTWPSNAWIWIFPTIMYFLEVLKMTKKIRKIMQVGWWSNLCIHKCNSRLYTWLNQSLSILPLCKVKTFDN